MTNMSDVSEVIDTAAAADDMDVVTRTLAIVEAPEPLKIKPFIDKPFVTGEGEIIANITPLQYPVRDLHIAALHHFLDGARFAVETPEGMQQAKKVTSRLSKLKTEMKEAYTAWNSPILEMTADARGKRDYIVAEVDSILTPIKEQIDAQTAKEKEESIRKARIESERIEGHTAALKVLTDMPTQYLSATSETIAKVIAEISSFDYLARRDWQEYVPAATDAIRASIATLNQHLENARARESLARLQAEQQQADLARERKEALRERIHNIELASTTVVDATSEAISRKLARIDQTDPATFDELAGEATAAIENTRNVLQTMLDAALKNEAAARQAAADAAELAELRAEKQRRDEAAATAAENAERERREAAERTAREAREAAEAAEQAARDEAARIQSEKEEAARVARERAEAVAETLLDLLIEARAHVPTSDLADRIDAAIATAQGE
jgi:hypothetical protein